MPTSIVDRFWYGIAATIISTIVASFIYVVFGLVTADGRVDYCYIESRFNQSYDTNVPAKVTYTLYGHRRWQQDSYIRVNAQEPSELVEFAASINCPIK